MDQRLTKYNDASRRRPGTRRIKLGMGSNPRQLYTAAQCRELDRISIEDDGTPGFELMRRAGHAAFAQISHRWPEADVLSVFCGKGNNAGDGYIIAGLAKARGLEVEVFEVGGPDQLDGDAALARHWAVDVGVTPEPILVASVKPRGQVIVDALLGTGLTGALRAPYAELVAQINAARLRDGCAVLAVDIPTGVNADTGGVTGVAVQADVTVTFIGPKIGLSTGAGLTHAGTVVFDDLGVGDSVRRRLVGVDVLSFPQELERHPLPMRNADAYKQALGHVVVVGGDRSMGGAPLLTGEAALRSGAGMVSIVTRAEHRPGILARRPELMVVDADDAEAVESVFERASLFVVGPGLGRERWGHQLLRMVHATGKPAVIDADGLNGLAVLNLTPSGEAIITPHTGEAAVLLNESSAVVQADRLAAARKLAQRVAGIAVLKGAGTVVAASKSGQSAVLGICAHGNPGMATAGMGDVLAGVIGGLWAQGASASTAARVGVCLHSLAADLAARQVGQRSLVATDILPYLIDLLKNR